MFRKEEISLLENNVNLLDALWLGQFESAVMIISLVLPHQALKRSGSVYKRLRLYYVGHFLTHC